MSGGGQKMTKMDAIQYIKEVEHMFQDKKEKFDEFLDVMNDYKRRRIDVGAVVAKVEDILKDHEDLIFGFNKFLPKGYEILLPLKDGVQFEDAVKFVSKIKARFRNKARVYNSFLDLIKSYDKGVPINEICLEVATLFEGHDDLVRDFAIFIPSTI